MREIVPDDVYREYVTRGEDWADKRGAADLLEHTIKIVLSEQLVKFKSAGMAVNEAEARARSCDEYREIVQQAVQARTEANKAHVRYTATQALFEARRSAEASNRAAMRSAT